MHVRYEISFSRCLNFQLESKCVLCNHEIENKMHLLYECRNSQQIFKVEAVSKYGYQNFPCLKLIEIVRL